MSQSCLDRHDLISASRISTTEGHYFLRYIRKPATATRRDRECRSLQRVAAVQGSSSILHSPTLDRTHDDELGDRKVSVPDREIRFSEIDWNEAGTFTVKNSRGGNHETNNSSQERVLQFKGRESRSRGEGRPWGWFGTGIGCRRRMFVMGASLFLSISKCTYLSPDSASAVTRPYNTFRPTHIAFLSTLGTISDRNRSISPWAHLSNPITRTAKVGTFRYRRL